MNRFVPTYGRWGGPGYSGGRRPKRISRHDNDLDRPIDEADELFMEHDFGYEDSDYLGADKRLVAGLAKLDPHLMSYPWLAKNVFRVISKARELGLLDPGVESNPGPRGSLKSRMAGKPWVNMEGDTTQTTPGFPNQQPQCSFLVANAAVAQPATWVQGAAGEVNASFYMQTTAAVNLIRPQPFIYDVDPIVPNHAVFRPIISKPTCFEINFDFSLICSALAANTQFRVKIYKCHIGDYATGSSYQTLTVDAFAGNNFFGMNFVRRIFLQPGQGISIGIQNFPFGGAVNVTGVSGFNTLHLGVWALGPAVGTYTGQYWLPFTDQQKGVDTGPKPEAPPKYLVWDEQKLPPSETDVYTLSSQEAEGRVTMTPFGDEDWNDESDEDDDDDSDVSTDIEESWNLIKTKLAKRKVNPRKLTVVLDGPR